jgi:hypothetical protein
MCKKPVCLPSLASRLHKSSDFHVLCVRCADGQRSPTMPAGHFAGGICSTSRWIDSPALRRHSHVPVGRLCFAWLALAAKSSISCTTAFRFEWQKPMHSQTRVRTLLTLLQLIAGADTHNRDMSNAGGPMQRFLACDEQSERYEPFGEGLAKIATLRCVANQVL